MYYFNANIGNKYLVITFQPLLAKFTHPIIANAVSKFITFSILCTLFTSMCRV